MLTTAPVAETVVKNRSWIYWTAILSALFVLLYAPVLKVLVLQWWNDPDYGHGFLVPLFAGYVVWRTRDQWTKRETKPSNFGLLVMIGAIVLLIGGSLGAELFTSRFSLLVLLAGMILFLAGWKVLRALSFPLAFLILMIPIPVIVYNQITFPLQLLASRFATFCLELVQVPVLREGNVLILPNYSLQVVEACSGIRSLMTLITLVASRRWIRYALVILMVPIAIVSNALRIMGTGVLTYRFGPRAAEGFFHEFSGWVIFLAALVLMFTTHWILKRFGPRRERLTHA
jgi:exosortase